MPDCAGKGDKGDHMRQEVTTRSAWVMASCCLGRWALKIESTIKSPSLEPIADRPSAGLTGACSRQSR